MSNYKKIIELFEEVKNKLSQSDLQYVLNRIEEYDSCTNTEETGRLEEGLISFCERKLNEK